MTFEHRGVGDPSRSDETIIIPTGMTGIQFVQHDPGGLGQRALSRFLQSTDQVDLMRSIATDPLSKDLKQDDGDWEHWRLQYGKEWEERILTVYLAAIADNPNTPTDVLAAVANRCRQMETDAQDDVLTATMSGGLANPSDQALDVRTALVNNPLTSAATLKELAESENWYQLALLVDWTDYRRTRPEFLTRVYESCATRMKGRELLYLNLAKNRYTPPEILISICQFFADPGRLQEWKTEDLWRFRDHILHKLLDLSNLPPESQSLLNGQIERVDAADKAHRDREVRRILGPKPEAAQE